MRKKELILLFIFISLSFLVSFLYLTTREVIETDGVGYF
jgi:hypothetical protein